SVTITVWCMRRSPSERTVSFWARGRPILLRSSVKLSFPMDSGPPAHGGTGWGGARTTEWTTTATASPTSWTTAFRGASFNRSRRGTRGGRLNPDGQLNAAALGLCRRLFEPFHAVHRRACHVDWIRAAERLC